MTHLKNNGNIGCPYGACYVHPTLDKMKQMEKEQYVSVWLENTKGINSAGASFAYHHSLPGW